MLANPLAVEKVDGHPLPHTVYLELSGIDQLQEGLPYKLEGYESGAFAGDPEWLNPNVQQPFQYRPSFVVKRVIEPAPLPPQPASP